MKHTKQFIAAAVMLSAIGGAYAQAMDSKDLTVKAKILAPACTVNISGDGKAEFNVDRGVLSTTTSTAVGSRDLDLTVDCEHPTMVILNVKDMQTAKPAYRMMLDWSGSKLTGLPTYEDTVTTRMFSLGENTVDGDTKPIGAYTLAFGVPTVSNDSGTVTARYIDDHTAPTATGFWSTPISGTNGLVVKHNRPYIAAFNAGTGAALDLPGKTFVFPMAVAASISKTGDLDPANDVQLDGHANIEVLYL